MKCDNEKAGIFELQQSSCREELARFCELDRQLNNAAPLRPGSSATSRTLVHVCWLVDAKELALELITELRHPENILANGKSQIAKFWDVYDRSLEALAYDRQFEAEFEQLKGAHLYWAPYPRLIAAITSHRDISQPMEDICESFQKRHRDKRVYLAIEDGHPNCPVRWDFRAVSILKFAGLLN
jgi:hypothetical protein